MLSLAAVAPQPPKDLHVSHVTSHNTSALGGAANEEGAGEGAGRDEAVVHGVQFAKVLLA